MGDHLTVLLRGRSLLLVTLVAIVAAGVATLLVTRQGGSADKPDDHPAAIFPATWPGDSLDGRWHPGGTWRLRDSATTAADDLSFDFDLRWEFPNQQMIIVARCDDGDVQISDDAGLDGTPCTGDFGKVVGGGIPAHTTVSVTRSQSHAWGIAVYTPPA
jgi:hypothetical protein